MTRTHNIAANRHEYRISRHGTFGATAAPCDAGFLVTVGNFTGDGFVADSVQPRAAEYMVAENLYQATIIVSKVRNRWLAA